MSVDATVAHSLARETGFKLELCKLALEKSKNDFVNAKVLITKWMVKKENPQMDNTQNLYSSLTSIVNDAAGCILKVSCTSHNLYEDDEFGRLCQEFRIELVSNEHTYATNTFKNNLEKQFNCKIFVEHKRFIKQNQNSLITTYRHRNNIVSMIEIEIADYKLTKHQLFKNFCFDCSMHVAAFNPISISAELIPIVYIDNLKKEIENQLSSEGKELIHWPMAVAGKVKKWSEQHSLMDQVFIKNDIITVNDVIQKVSNEIGSQIKINRFARLSTG